MGPVVRQYKQKKKIWGEGGATREQGEKAIGASHAAAMDKEVKKGMQK